MLFFANGGEMIKNFFEKIGKIIESNKISGIIIAFISFIIIGAVSFSNGYKRFDLNLFDISFSMKPQIEEWDRLAFVDIDDNSTAALGRFPWPRHLYGRAMDALKDIGVTQATFDIMFPDPSSLEISMGDYENLSKYEGKTLPTDEVKKMITDNDLMFAKGVRNMGSVILAYSMSNDELVKDAIVKRSTASYKKAEARFWERATQKVDEKDYDKYKSLIDERVKSVYYPIPELMNTAHGFGFVNRDTDIDGAVRKVRLVHFFENRLYFNLALVMLADASSIALDDIEVIPGEKIILKNGFNPLNYKNEDIIIPIDKEGMMYVNWAKGRREETFKIVPFYALVEYFNHLKNTYDLFDYWGGALEIQERDAIAKEINVLRKQLNIVEDAEQRGNLRKQIVELMQKDRSLKDNHVKNAQTDIDNIIALKSLRDRYIVSEIDQEKEALYKNIFELLQTIEEASNEPMEVTDEYVNLVLEDLAKGNNSIFNNNLIEYQRRRNAIDLILSVESLRDNITISGLTATGTIDIGQTPTSNEFAMVGTYHNTINTIVQQKFIKIAPTWINFIIMFIIAMVMGFTIQRLSARASIFTIISSLFALNAVIIGAFIFGNLWFDQLGVSLALIIPSASIAAIKLMREESQKQFIKSAFSLYLSPGVIDKIIENPESLGLGGEEREITIFFSDVAKFSTISEKLKPQELVALLNEYLSEMTDIILANGGTVDKYEGDAIIAFFGAPQPFEDHALRCCMAAIQQKKRLEEMQEVWRAAGKDILTVRMGINSGVAVVGNMGSRTRFDYTVMGDSVNLASRLEGVNKVYNTCAMISSSTYDYVKDAIEVRRLDSIRVVGKNEPVIIYEVLDTKGALSDKTYSMIEKYYKGLELFQERRWQEAIDAFKKALKIVSDDGPSLTFIERCQTYMKEPPPKNWDGVYRLTSK